MQGVPLELQEVTDYSEKSNIDQIFERVLSGRGKRLLNCFKEVDPKYGVEIGFYQNDVLGGACDYGHGVFIAHEGKVVAREIHFWRDSRGIHPAMKKVSHAVVEDGVIDIFIEFNDGRTKKILSWKAE